MNNLSICIFVFIINISLIYCNWNSIDLIQNRIYRLYWKLIEEDKVIQYKVEAKSRGYFGLGISKNGKMDDSDIVSGYIHNNGTALLYNRFSIGHNMPEIDDKPNWKLISGKRNETHLIFEFKRNLTIEDNSKDVPIEKGETYVIYSLGKVDPKDRTKIKYHGNKSRGSKKIVFVK